MRRNTLPVRSATPLLCFAFFSRRFASRCVALRCAPFLCLSLLVRALLRGARLNSSLLCLCLAVFVRLDLVFVPFNSMLFLPTSLRFSSVYMSARVFRGLLLLCQERRCAWFDLSSRFLSQGMRAAVERSLQAHPKNIQLKRAATRLLQVLDDEAVPTRPNHIANRACADRHELASGARDFAIPLHQWLLELDSSGFLMPYHGSLLRLCGSLWSVVQAYTTGGKLEQRFFHDLKISKLGAFCRARHP